jgi:ABC-2 type transporter
VAQSVSIEQLDSEGFFPTDKREMGDASSPEFGKDALGITLTRSPKSLESTADERPPRMATQISLLFNREFRNLRRNTAALKTRIRLTIFMGTLVGLIFLDVGKSDPSIQSNIQSHFGAMVMVLFLSMIGNALPALLAFPAERPVFLREYTTNHYSVVSYFISRLTMEAFITALQVFVQVRQALIVGNRTSD